jgi:glycosyltransferase involved in cell wall biosynthesis
MSKSSPRVGLDAEPLRLLVVDKVSVLRSIRHRHRILIERGDVELTLLAPAMWVENLTPTPFQHDPADNFRVVLGRVVWPGREQRSFYTSGLLHAFRTSRPEVILMLEESFSLFGLQVVLLKKLLAPSARVIFYSNNITTYDRFGYWPSWFYRLLGSVVMKMCDAALCVNTTAENVLRRTRFAGTIRTLFYGINEELFAPRSRSEARARLNLSSTDDVFLYAGKLLPLKGIQDLIGAFSTLRQKLPDRNLRLVIVGSGEHENILRALVHERQVEDRVEFHSMVPLEEMPWFISAANALVLPSRAEIEEQFGRVVAEAMLMNVTVIGSTSGAIAEVVGDGGFIFRAGDADDLCRVMESVLIDGDEVERRRTLARSKALSEYSMLGFVEGVIKLLEEITGRRLRRAVKA